MVHPAELGTPVEQLKDVGSGEVGELYVKGGNVAMGYWNNEASTKEAFLTGGWLRTGDQVSFVF